MKEGEQLGKELGERRDQWEMEIRFHLLIAVNIGHVRVVGVDSVEFLVLLHLPIRQPLLLYWAKGTSEAITGSVV